MGVFSLSYSLVYQLDFLKVHKNGSSSYFVYAKQTVAKETPWVLLKFDKVGLNKQF